ncbi:DUF998 domain-containing protein [Nonomuraea sp. NPDC049152]|uniref:DUF998 domain-containing protein n=1 Tax=Nonomuraea sp. NPDC049152 TaxID=3154350 RepID=UPI0033F0AD9E
MHGPARAGLAAVAAGAVVIAGLDIAYLGEINPLRRTISEHGLGDEAWVFGLGVALLAMGSLAIGVSLLRRRLAGALGLVALLGWSLGLLVVAWFPKHDWSVGPSVSGSIHRVGSFVAFLCLPVAAMLIARTWRKHPRAALAAFVLGGASLLWVAGIATMIAIGNSNGMAWWRVMPLGLVERGLAVTEVGALIALGVWAASRAVTNGPAPLRPVDGTRPATEAGR